MAVAIDPNKAVAYACSNGTCNTGTNSIAHDTETFNTNFRIGNDTQDGDRYFDGQIDDVRIYDRALSKDEIKRLYDLGQ